MKVLITSGGTEEPIDGVRTISNFSSGKTGAAIAEYFHSMGAEVYFLYGQKSLCPDLPFTKTSYKSFKDLEHALSVVLAEVKFDAVIHLAAISDYSPVCIEAGKEKFIPGREKIDSSKFKEIKIILKRNPKLVSTIKNGLNANTFLVAFKLTNSKDSLKQKIAIEKILQNEDIDLLIHNDLNQIDNNSHVANFYKNKKLIYTTQTRPELAKLLYESTVGESR